MPGFKSRQKNSLIVFERGHKAHGYVQTADGFPLATGPTLCRRFAAGNATITKFSLRRAETVCSSSPDEKTAVLWFDGTRAKARDYILGSTFGLNVVAGFSPRSSSFS